MKHYLVVWGILKVKTFFRPFQNEKEEISAKEIIAAIDRGEKGIFDNNKGASQERLYCACKDTIGVYCEYIIDNDNELHIQIGFNTDMPDELASELLALVQKARQNTNLVISIWYSPRNKKLEEFLFHNFSCKKKGDKTYEFTALRKDFENIDYKLPQDIIIVPFEEKYIVDTCIMLDKSLAHTFDEEAKGIFLENQDALVKEWAEKARLKECYIMMEKDTVVGAYIINGSEIDIIAIAIEKQGKGLGKQLLRHAIKNILLSSKDLPYLYCKDYNRNSVQFYLHEGMKVTGYSGYVLL